MAINLTQKLPFGSTPWYKKSSLFLIPGLSNWWKGDAEVYEDGAVQFTAADKSHLTVASNATLQATTTFEVGCWVYIDTVGQPRAFLTKGIAANVAGEYALYYSATATNFRMAASDGTNVKTVTDTGAAPSTSTWYFIQAGRKSNGDLYIRRNGGSQIVGENLATPIQASTNAFNVGFDGTTGTDTHMAGRIDSAYLSTANSSDAESTALYNAGAGRMYSDLTADNGLSTFATNLVSWWGFQEPTGIRYDSKGTNHLSEAFTNIIDASTPLLNGGFETAGAGETLGSELLTNIDFETSGTNGGLISGALTSTVARASNVATIVTATNHGLVNNNVATIASCTDTTFNASSVTVTRVNDTTFTYSNTGSDVGTTADTTGQVTTLVFGTWDSTPSGGRITKSSSSPHGGTYHAMMETVTTNPWVKQAFTTTASTRYKFTFWTAGDGSVAGRYLVYDGTNAATIIPATTTGITSGTYTQVTVYFTTPAGCISALVYLYGPNSAGTCYYDDVSVKQVTAYAPFGSWVTTVAGSSQISDEGTIVQAGSHAAKFVVDSSNSDASVAQTVLTAGKNYTVTFYARGAAGSEQVVVGDPGLNWQIFTLTTSYAACTVSARATSSSLRIRRLNASNTFYVDSVTLIANEILGTAGIARGIAQDRNFCSSFSGVTQKLSRASNAGLQTGDIDFTVWGWINLQAKSVAGDQYLIDKYLTTGNQREYRLYWNRSTDRFAFGVSPDGTTTGLTAVSDSTTGSPNVGDWYFIVAWHDSINNLIWIQTNNATAVSAAYSSGLTAGTGDVTIGAPGATGNPVSCFIDQCGFIKRVLTTDERTAMFNAGRGVKYAGLPASVKTDANLISVWDLESTADAHGTNTLTNTGTVTFTSAGVNYQEGLISRVSNLASTNHITQTTNASRLWRITAAQNGRPAIRGDGLTKALSNSGDIIGTGDLTFFAAFKGTTAGGGNLGRFVDNTKFLVNFNGAMTTRVSCTSDGATTASSATAIAASTAYTLIITRTSTGVTNFYLNGTLSGTADQASGTPAAGSPTYIGNSAAGTRGFDGDIYEIGSYGAILTGAQIAQLNRYLRSRWGI